MTYKDLTKDELISVLEAIIYYNGLNRNIVDNIIDLLEGNLNVISNGEGKWYLFKEVDVYEN